MHEVRKGHVSRLTREEWLADQKGGPGLRPAPGVTNESKDAI